jgi:hypothetical protein
MAKTKSKPKVHCANPDCNKTIGKINETICSDCRRLAYRLSLRIKCSNYFNDKCEDCGFLRKTIEELNLFDFHHKNMADKRFTISNAIIRNNWEEISVELAKCEMLCKFCHAYRHLIERNDFIKITATNLAQEGQ